MNRFFWVVVGVWDLYEWLLTTLLRGSALAGAVVTIVLLGIAIYVLMFHHQSLWAWLGAGFLVLTAAAIADAGIKGLFSGDW